MVEEGKNVVSIGQANKNSILLGVGTDSRNTIGDAIEKFLVVCAPKMPQDYRVMQGFQTLIFFIKWRFYKT